jgi:hypothetical protein
MGLVCSCLRGDIVEPPEKYVITPDRHSIDKIGDKNFNYRKFMDELI